MELKTNKIFFKYNNSQNNVLKALTFSFKGPGLYAITGKNASGKTTLLKILSGHLIPQNGTINLNNKITTKLFLTKITTFIPEPFILLDPILIKRIIDNFTNLINTQAIIDLNYLNFTLSSSTNFKKVISLLIKEIQNKNYKYDSLSHGYKNLLKTLAIASINTPIINIDEPLNSLDTNLKKVIINLLSFFSLFKLILFSHPINPTTSSQPHKLNIINMTTKTSSKTNSQEVWREILS